LAVLFSLLGAAVGRTFSPFVCPVGRQEFKAKVTVCDDGKAYRLEPVDYETAIETDTSTTGENDGR
jgi:hypothetical protein